MKSFILGFMAWQFGSLYRSVESEVGLSEEIVIVGIIIDVICFIFYKNIENKSQN